MDIIFTHFKQSITFLRLKLTPLFSKKREKSIDSIR